MYQNYQESNVKVKKRPILFSKLGKPKAWLRDETFKVSHLKAQIMVKKYLVFKDEVPLALLESQILIWKVPILLHTVANERKHSQRAVFIKLLNHVIRLGTYYNIY